MSNESTTRRARRRAIVWPARWGIAVLLAGGLMLIDACSSSSSTAAGAPSAAPSLSPTPAKVNCKNVDSLRASLESLSHTNVSPTSAGTLTKDLKNIQTQLAALKSQRGGQF